MSISRPVRGVPLVVCLTFLLAANLHAGAVQGQDTAAGSVDKFVWITALSDSPDPFSASAKGTCVVKTAYRVRVHPGDTSDGKPASQPAGKSPQTTFTRWLRQSVTITDQAGQVVRKLETVKQLPEPQGKSTAAPSPSPLPMGEGQGEGG